MWEAHDEGHKCEHCGRKFEKKKTYDTHIKRVKEQEELREQKLFLFKGQPLPVELETLQSFEGE